MALERAMPPGFGVARTHDTGMASNELIYEFEYHPKPVRKLEADFPVHDAAFLRPAVRQGKVAFSFFGSRVPLSADHARCWLGQVLLTEVQGGMLQCAEFIVQPNIEQRPRTYGGLEPHGSQPSWLWHAWRGGSYTDSSRRPMPVAVCMNIGPLSGFAIQLSCDDEAVRCHVFRVLRKYCDSDTDRSSWHPIPDAPARIGKVQSREMSGELMRRRLVGLPVPDSGGKLLAKSLDELATAEFHTVRAVSRIEATRESASLPDMRLYLGDVLEALMRCSSSGLKPRVEWHNVISVSLEALVRRSQESGDAENMDRAMAIVSRMQEYGVHPPSDFDRLTADRLAGSETPA